MGTWKSTVTKHSPSSKNGTWQWWFPRGLCSFSGADFQVNHVQLQQCIPKMKFSHHEDENKRYIMFRYPDLKLHVPLLLGGASPPKLYVFCCWCIFWELIIQENDNININQEVTQKKLQNDRTRLVLFLVDSRLKKNNLMIQWYACIHVYIYICEYIYVNIDMLVHCFLFFWITNAYCIRSYFYCKYRDVNIHISKKKGTYGFMRYHISYHMVYLQHPRQNQLVFFLIETCACFRLAGLYSEFWPGRTSADQVTSRWQGDPKRDPEIDARKIPSPRIGL